MQEAAINEGLSTDGNKYKGFNKEVTNRKVMQILETSNVQSILNDNVFTGEATMAENIKDYIGGLSYQALGIDTVSSTGQVYDTDGDGKISMEEAKLISQEDSDKIFSALTDPENKNYNEGITKKTVGNYYTSILEKNYGGAREDVAQANEKNYDLLAKSLGIDNKSYFDNL